MPAPRTDVPEGEVVPRESECDRPRLPGHEEDGVEAPQVARCLLRGRRRERVELRDLRARRRACVGEHERDVDDRVVEPAMQDDEVWAVMFARAADRHVDLDVPGVEGRTRPEGLARAARRRAAEL